MEHFFQIKMELCETEDDSLEQDRSSLFRDLQEFLDFFFFLSRSVKWKPVILFYFMFNECAV